MARGTRALADFASYLNQTQLRLLRGSRNPKTEHYEPPSEPTIRRMLKNVPAAEFDARVCAWMAQKDLHPYVSYMAWLNRGNDRVGLLF